MKSYSKLERIFDSDAEVLEQTEQQRQQIRSEEVAFFGLVGDQKNVGLQHSDPFFKSAIKQLKRIVKRASVSE